MEYDPNVRFPSRWKGKNLLGCMLTSLREQFREEAAQLEVRVVSNPEDTRAFVNLMVDGVAMKGLVDSGACRTLIRQDIMVAITRANKRALLGDAHWAKKWMCADAQK